jgi:hypothetical protein
MPANVIFLKKGSCWIFLISFSCNTKYTILNCSVCIVSVYPGHGWHYKHLTWQQSCAIRNLPWYSVVATD